MSKKQQNKLAPKTAGAGIRNFFLNIAIAVVWLMKWMVRLLRRPFQGKDE